MAHVKVLLTRKHWNRFLLPLLVATILIGGLAYWQTGERRFFVAPLLPLLLWGILYFGTPKTGMRALAIQSSPGQMTLLWFSAAALLLTALLMTFDVFVLGQPIHAPLKLYHILLALPPFALMLTGATIAGKKLERELKEEKAKRAAESKDAPAS